MPYLQQLCYEDLDLVLAFVLVLALDVVPAQITLSIFCTRARYPLQTLRVFRNKRQTLRLTATINLTVLEWNMAGMYAGLQLLSWH